MARQTLFQKSLIGIQTAAGTAVQALKLLPLSVVELQPQAEFSEVRVPGKRFHSSVNVIKESTVGNVSGQLSYNDEVYWLSMFMDYAAPVTADSVSTWTFEDDLACANVSKYATLFHGENCERAERAKDAIASGMTWTFDRTQATKSYNLLAAPFEDGVSQLSLAITGSPTGGTFTITYNTHATSGIAYNASAADVKAALVALADFDASNIEVSGGALPGTAVTLTLLGLEAIQAADFSLNSAGLTGGTTPTAAITAPSTSEIAVQQILPQEVSAYMATEQSGLDSATALARNTSVVLTYTGKRVPFYALNAANGNGYKEALEAAADATVSITIAKDAEGADFLEAMRDGDIMFMRVKALGGVIGATATQHEMSMELAFMVNSAPSDGDTEGLMVSTYGGRIVHDATWGKGISITIKNGVAAL